MTAPRPRPGAVTAAFWLLLVGAVLLLTGGLLAATVGFETLRQAAGPSVSDQSIRDYLRLYRGAGILFSLAAVALAIFAIKARNRDQRSRRATMSLGLAVVVLAAIAAVFAGTHVLALLSMVPIIIGTLLLGRPAAADWFSGWGDGSVGR
jgi:uncharacterized membrane protein YidH (DUF202 family)